MTKMAETDTNISELSPLHFVFNIRHQHGCRHVTTSPHSFMIYTPLCSLNVCWLCKMKKTGSFLKPVKRTNLNFTILAFKWHSMKYLKISKFLCEWHCFIALLLINTNLSSFSIWTQLLFQNLMWFVRILRKFWLLTSSYHVIFLRFRYQVLFTKERT